MARKKTCSMYYHVICHREIRHWTQWLQADLVEISLSSHVSFSLRLHGWTLFNQPFIHRWFPQHQGITRGKKMVADIESSSWVFLLILIFFCSSQFKCKEVAISTTCFSSMLWSTQSAGLRAASSSWILPSLSQMHKVLNRCTCFMNPFLSWAHGIANFSCSEVCKDRFKFVLFPLRAHSMIPRF